MAARFAQQIQSQCKFNQLWRQSHKEEPSEAGQQTLSTSFQDSPWPEEDSFIAVLGICHAPSVDNLTAAVQDFFRSPWACDTTRGTFGTGSSASRANICSKAPLQGPAALAGLHVHCLVVDPTTAQTEAGLPAGDSVSFAEYGRTSAAPDQRSLTAAEEDLARRTASSGSGVGGESGSVERDATIVKYNLIGFVHGIIGLRIQRMLALDRDPMCSAAVVLGGYDAAPRTSERFRMRRDMKAGYAARGLVQQGDNAMLLGAGEDALRLYRQALALDALAMSPGYLAAARINGWRAQAVVEASEDGVSVLCVDRLDFPTPECIKCVELVDGSDCVPLLGMQILALCLADASLATIEPRWWLALRKTGEWGDRAAAQRKELPPIHSKGALCLARVRAVEISGRSLEPGDDLTGSIAVAATEPRPESAEASEARSSDTVPCVRVGRAARLARNLSAVTYTTVEEMACIACRTARCLAFAGLDASAAEVLLSTVAAGLSSSGYAVQTTEEVLQQVYLFAAKTHADLFDFVEGQVPRPKGDKRANAHAHTGPGTSRADGGTLADGEQSTSSVADLFTSLGLGAAVSGTTDTDTLGPSAGEASDTTKQAEAEVPILEQGQDSSNAPVPVAPWMNAECQEDVVVLVPLVVAAMRLLGVDLQLGDSSLAAGDACSTSGPRATGLVDLAARLLAQLGCLVQEPAVALAGVQVCLEAIYSGNAVVSPVLCHTGRTPSKASGRVVVQPSQLRFRDTVRSIADPLGYLHHMASRLQRPSLLSESALTQEAEQERYGGSQASLSAQPTWSSTLRATPANPHWGRALVDYADASDLGDKLCDALETLTGLSLDELCVQQRTRRTKQSIELQPEASEVAGTGNNTASGSWSSRAPPLPVGSSATASASASARVSASAGIQAAGLLSVCAGAESLAKRGMLEQARDLLLHSSVYHKEPQLRCELIDTLNPTNPLVPHVTSVVFEDDLKAEEGLKHAQSLHAVSTRGSLNRSTQMAGPRLKMWQAGRHHHVHLKASLCNSLGSNVQVRALLRSCDAESSESSGSDSDWSQSDGTLSTQWVPIKLANDVGNFTEGACALTHVDMSLPVLQQSLDQWFARQLQRRARSPGKAGATELDGKSRSSAPAIASGAHLTQETLLNACSSLPDVVESVFHRLTAHSLQFVGQGWSQTIVVPASTAPASTILPWHEVEAANRHYATAEAIKRQRMPTLSGFGTILVDLRSIGEIESTAIELQILATTRRMGKERGVLLVEALPVCLNSTSMASASSSGSQMPCLAVQGVALLGFAQHPADVVDASQFRLMTAPVATLLDPLVLDGKSYQKSLTDAVSMAKESATLQKASGFCVHPDVAVAAALMQPSVGTLRDGRASTGMLDLLAIHRERTQSTTEATQDETRNELNGTRRPRGVAKIQAGIEQRKAEERWRLAAKATMKQAALLSFEISSELAVRAYQVCDNDTSRGAEGGDTPLWTQLAVSVSCPQSGVEARVRSPAGADTDSSAVILIPMQLTKTTQ